MLTYKYKFKKTKYTVVSFTRADIQLNAAPRLRPNKNGLDLWSHDTPQACRYSSGCLVFGCRYCSLLMSLERMLVVLLADILLVRVKKTCAHNYHLFSFLLPDTCLHAHTHSSHSLAHFLSLSHPFILGFTFELFLLLQFAGWFLWLIFHSTRYGVLVGKNEERGSILRRMNRASLFLMACCVVSCIEIRNGVLTQYLFIHTMIYIYRVQCLLSASVTLRQHHVATSLPHHRAPAHGIHNAITVTACTSNLSVL